MAGKEKIKSEEREEISVIGILDIVDLAVLLRISSQTARRYINEKRIPAYKVVPGKYLISVKQLEKYIEENAIKWSKGKKRVWDGKKHFKKHSLYISNSYRLRRFDNKIFKGMQLVYLSNFKGLEGLF